MNGVQAEGDALATLTGPEIVSQTPRWFWEQLDSGLPAPGPWPLTEEQQRREGWIEPGRLYRTEVWNRRELMRIVARRKVT